MQGEHWGIDKKLVALGRHGQGHDGVLVHGHGAEAFGIKRSGLPVILIQVGEPSVDAITCFH